MNSLSVVDLKVPMVAILVSLIFPTNPPLAASMVIDRPEATGASPVRAEAKRRMAEDFLVCARNAGP